VIAAPVSSDARGRLADRGEAVVEFVKSPVETIKRGVEESNAKQQQLIRDGKYFDAGIVSGERIGAAGQLASGGPGLAKGFASMSNKTRAFTREAGDLVTQKAKEALPKVGNFVQRAIPADGLKTPKFLQGFDAFAPQVKFSVAPEGKKLAKNAEDRAIEIHKAVPEATQRRTTIAITETAEGTRIVSSSEKRLRKAQRAELGPGEIEGVGIGHAEETGINFAKQNELTPTGVGASRPICKRNCQPILLKEDVKPLSPLQK